MSCCRFGLVTPRRRGSGWRLIPRNGTSSLSGMLANTVRVVAGSGLRAAVFMLSAPITRWRTLLPAVLILRRDGQRPRDRAQRRAAGRPRRCRRGRCHGRADPPGRPAAARNGFARPTPRCCRRDARRRQRWAGRRHRAGRRAHGHERAAARAADRHRAALRPRLSFEAHLRAAALADASVQVIDDPLLGFDLDTPDDLERLDLDAAAHARAASATRSSAS